MSFRAGSRARILVNLKDPWCAIREAAGLDDVAYSRPSPFSFASVGAAGGASLPIIGALLGHTQAQTTHGCPRYAHLADDPLQAAAADITGRIVAAMGDAARRAAEEERDRRKRIEQARILWRRGGDIGGTLADRYLRNRAIRATLAPSLRFNGKAWHREAARSLPAMVAAVTHEGAPAAEPLAVHVTYLREPGAKATVYPDKRMHGPVKGGAVRLSEGPGPLVVAEGLETALSLLDALAAHRPRVWAALSANGMKGLTLPAEPGELVAAPDPDRTGWDAAEALATRARAAGWRARILPPPGDGGDWNAAAIRRAAA
jgi:hypothetical protein